MNKDRFNDLSSLFVPDITLPNNTTAIKQEPDQEYMINQSPTQTSDFNTFINNNDFITKTNQILDGDRVNFNEDVMPHSHYSSFVDGPKHNHNVISNLFPSSNTQPKESNWFTMESDMLKYTTPGSTPGNQLMANNAMNNNINNGSNVNLNEFFDNSQHMYHPSIQTLTYQQTLQQIQQLVGQLPNSVLMDSNLNLNPNTSSLPTPSSQGSTAGPSEKKRKIYKKSRDKMKNNGVIIDYSPPNLTKLLDLKCKRLSNDCKILDKSGNEISLDFKGFLNGKFLTNDFDNSNYIYSILQDDPKVDLKDQKGKIIKTDPKVISCYRRNFIQLSFNFNLSGFKDYNSSDSRILKLQTNEFGYNITRVIKWFKIEITAHSNISKNRSVPLIISDDPREKEAKREDLNVDKTDYIMPSSINTAEQIITLNNAEIINDEIDNFFTVKKLQFKNATPNNGNLTFQNYYHLKIKLSAIVADLYYDDYIEEEFSVTNPDNSRNEINLFELETEPIIVRGRNPSFYAERKDILVKGRSVTSKENYKKSGKSFAEAADFKVEDSESKEDENETSDKDIQESDIENEPEEEEVIESDKKSSTPTPIPTPLFNFKNSNKAVPPLILNTMATKQNISEIFNDDSSYKYLPISNVYYLPPVNVVYFPHSAHQHNMRTKSPAIEEQPRRKSSNVYFK